MNPAVVVCVIVAVVSALLIIGDQIVDRIRQRHIETREVTALVAELRSRGIEPDLTAKPRDLLASLRTQAQLARESRAVR